VKNFFFIFIFFLLNKNASAQCFERNFAFLESETLSYEVYYNWGFIWLNAGWVDFKVKAATYQNRPVYHFDAYGSSHKSYDWMYTVRDSYQAYLDKESFQPLWFDRKNKYLFDNAKKKVYIESETSDRPFRRDTLAITNCTFDLISIVYYCRNLSFKGMHIGDSIPVRTLVDNEVFNLYIRYLGTEKLKTREGETFNCIKFSALLVEGTIFKEGEDLFVWVTNDLNRVPILVEAKILIGSVKAYLKTTSGLRNPVSAKIK
jgi:hypothetical protein